MRIQELGQRNKDTDFWALSHRDDEGEEGFGNERNLKLPYFLALFLLPHLLCVSVPYSLSLSFSSFFYSHLLCGSVQKILSKYIYSFYDEAVLGGVDAGLQGGQGIVREDGY